MDIKKKKSSIYKSKINENNEIKLKNLNHVKFKKVNKIKCGNFEKNNTKYKIVEKKKKEKKIEKKKKEFNIKNEEISKKKKKLEKKNTVTKKTKKKECNNGNLLKDIHKDAIKIKNYDNNDKKKDYSKNDANEKKEIIQNRKTKNKETNNENRKSLKKRKIEGMSVTKDLDEKKCLSLYAEIKKKSDNNNAKRPHIYLNKNEKPFKSLKNNEETYNKLNNSFYKKVHDEEKKDEKDKIDIIDKINNNNNNSYGNADNNNVSPFDYEKLLVSKKNKSAIWISYITYYIQQNNLDEARKVAERALKTIDIQEVEEKLNIYLCYLNMECLYGDKLYDVFKRALLCNNEKSIYLHMINILKKNNKLIQLKEICEEAIKKFKYSKKIWSCYLEILHNTFKDEEYAHSILLKSLHSLEKRKHLKMIINAARFEYKYSNKERGKTYFEKLIQEYPKRSDIWFTYLDIHINSLTKNEKKEKIKLNMTDIEFIRNIFERFISINFKPRIMKMIFTKWLLFEKNHGNLNNQKIVQQKAYDYVESLNTVS